MSVGIGLDEPPWVKALFSPTGTPASLSIGIGCGAAGPPGTTTVKAFGADAAVPYGLIIIWRGAGAADAAAFHDADPVGTPAAGFGGAAATGAAAVRTGAGAGAGAAATAGAETGIGTPAEVLTEIVAGLRMPVVRAHQLRS